MAPKTAEKAVKAPATKAPAAKKVVKKATSGASKKKTKAVESYKIYIYKVLKQVQTSPRLEKISMEKSKSDSDTCYSGLQFIDWCYASVREKCTGESQAAVGRNLQSENRNIGAKAW
jgi:hypothetical protein